MSSFHSKLEWHFARQEPQVGMPSADTPAVVSRRCLVRTENPTFPLIIGIYVKRHTPKGIEGFWQNELGEKIEWNVLAWASLFDTEYALDVVFPIPPEQD